MRYAPEQRLFFVHIPKCAGLSVVRALKPVSGFPWSAFAADLGWDEARTRAEIGLGFTHPTRGPLHPAHLPLHLLASDFPHTFGLLRQSTTFAIVRDPRDRFLSALNQHLREFGQMGATAIAPAVLRDTAARVCDTERTKS